MSDPWDMLVPAWWEAEGRKKKRGANETYGGGKFSSFGFTRLCVGARGREEKSPIEGIQALLAANNSNNGTVLL